MPLWWEKYEPAKLEFQVSVVNGKSLSSIEYPASSIEFLDPQSAIPNPQSRSVPHGHSLNLFLIVLGDYSAKSFAAHRGEVFEAYHHSQRHNFLIFIWF